MVGELGDIVLSYDEMNLQACMTVYMARGTSSMRFIFPAYSRLSVHTVVPPARLTSSPAVKRSIL